MTDHLKDFERARENLVKERRDTVRTLAGEYTESTIKKLVELQAAIEAIEQARKEEPELPTKAPMPAQQPYQSDPPSDETPGEIPRG
jgi:hypothetical protein